MLSFPFQGRALWDLEAVRTGGLIWGLSRNKHRFESDCDSASHLDDYSVLLRLSENLAMMNNSLGRRSRSINKACAKDSYSVLSYSKALPTVNYTNSPSLSSPDLLLLTSKF